MELYSPTDDRTWTEAVCTTPGVPLAPDQTAVGHVHGFDYARCLLAFAVVALHTRAFGESAAAQAVYDHFLSLAVPSFFLISLFLFVNKAGERRGDLVRRLQRLALLFVVWSGVYAVIVRDFSPFTLARHSVTGMIRVAVTGGNPIFYFFSCLAFLTLVTAATRRLPQGVLWPCALLSTCGLWWMSSLAGGVVSEELKNYYNPLNFLPFVFIAPILASQVRNGAPRMPAWTGLALFSVLCISFTIAVLLERHFLRTADGHIPSQYSRPSAVIGALAVVWFSLANVGPAPFLVKRLSDYSLGLYCVHVFVKQMEMISALPVPFVRFMAVVAVSIALVAFLRRAIAFGML